MGKHRRSLPPAGRGSGIGTPADLVTHLQQYQEAGVDQVVFIQQGGRNKHEHICEALDLFAHDVMPEFKEKEARRIAKKQEELAPYIEKAFARKARMKELADDEIPNIVALGRILARHRGLRVHLAMSPPVAFFASNGRYEFPEELLAVYRHQALMLEVMFPITYGGVWDYPYPEAQSLVESLRDQVGAGRLMWGSDMPNVERFCTYRQSLDYVRKYCPFLTAREKDLILGDNCAAFYGIGK